MARARRASMTAGVTFCLLSVQFNGLLFASEPTVPPAVAADPAVITTAAEGQPSASEVSSAPGSQGAQREPARFAFDAARLVVDPSMGTVWRAPRGFKVKPSVFSASAGQVYQGPPYPYPYRVRHDGSIAAIMIGAAAAITGTAVLVYANRPECTANAAAGGCGYGTKVVGAAVLSGGVVGLFVGALTWR